MNTNIPDYTAQIKRDNPTCVLILVDQSRSMSEPFGRQPDTTKAQGVAAELNRLLTNLVLKSTIKGGIGDYTHIGVLGFGSSVSSAFGGALANKELVPVSEIADHPLRIDTQKVQDGARVREITTPIWIEPEAKGDTPMTKAFTTAHRWVAKFLSQYPHCFPPTVICITDGQPTDENPKNAARQLCDLQSSNGNVLLFNIHITSSSTEPRSFPTDVGQLPDDIYARFLFRHSSVIPPVLVQEAMTLGYTDIQYDSRGFIFNGDFNSVTRLLTFGTRVNNK